MTTALVVITLVISVLVLAGLKDKNKQLTPFAKQREAQRHWHY